MATATQRRRPKLRVVGGLPTRIPKRTVPVHWSNGFREVVRAWSHEDWGRLSEWEKPEALEIPGIGFLDTQPFKGTEEEWQAILSDYWTQLDHLAPRRARSEAAE